MKNFLKEYDLTLAAVALHFLWYQAYESNEEESLLLSRFVWKPQEKFFLEMAKGKPVQINCLFGEERHFPEKTEGAICKSVYAVNRRSQIAYLGTVFNRRAISEDRLRMRPEDQKFLKAFAWAKKIVRDTCFCVIPSGTDAIDESVIVKAVKKFFKSFDKSATPEITNLAQADIALFSPEKGVKIEQEIKRLAKLSKLPSLKNHKEFFDEFALEYAASINTR